MRSFKFNLILLIATFCVLSGTCNAQYSVKLELKHDYDLLTDSTIKKIKLEEKSPLLAGTLSFIVPGLAMGQFYNEQTGKFIIHAAISAVCITTFAISMQHVEIKLDIGGKTVGEENGKSKTAGAFAFFSAVIFAGNYIITVADAIVSAQNINMQYQQQKNRSMLEQRLIFGFTLEKNNQLKFKAILNL